MAIIRELNNSDTYSTYLSTIALFCGISCTLVMIKFKGFKATLNLSSGKSNGNRYELAQQVSIAGAYRTNREEYFGNINYLDGRKTITPSMVKLPPSAQTQNAGTIKPSKSTGDITKVQNVPVDLRKSTPNVSVQNAPPGTREAKNELKAQKKLEKERLIEQKKKDKLAAQEREKQENIRKEAEKKAAQQQAKEAKERQKQKKKKGVAPQPQRPTPQQLTSPQRPIKTQQTEQRTLQKGAAPPPPPPPPPPHFKKVAQRVQPTTNTSQNPVQNSRNSLESSISRSSGPPPYSDTAGTIPNKTDNSGNTSYGKTEESSSWDMISQHRQQMSRTAAAAVHVHNAKQKNIGMRYNVGNVTDDRDNSEA